MGASSLQHALNPDHVRHGDLLAFLLVEAIHQGDADTLDQVRLASGDLDDLLDRAIFQGKDAPDGLSDQLLRIRLGERLDLDLLEEVVPGTSLAFPVFLDCHAGYHRGKILREVSHEQTAQPLIDPGIVRVELVDFVDQQDDLDLLVVLLLEHLDYTDQVSHQVTVIVGRRLGDRLCSGR